MKFAVTSLNLRLFASLERIHEMSDDWTMPNFGVLREQDKNRAKIANLGEANQSLLLRFKSW